MAQYTTVFGSLDDYEKGGVEVINDDPKHLVDFASLEAAKTVQTLLPK